MMQQINLYQPVFRRERKVFSAVAMLEVLAVIVVALLGVYAWQSVATHALQRQLNVYQQRQAVAQKHLSKLLLKLSSRKVSPILTAAISRAKRELEGRRTVLRVLSSQSHGNMQGFAAVLNALSHSVHAGIWLTRVNLSDGGTQLVLAGRITQGEKLPQYLNQLRHQSVVSGYRFTKLKIVRDKDTGQLHFLLATLGVPSGAKVDKP